MFDFKKTMIAAFVASSVFSLSGCLDSGSDSNGTTTATDPLADAAASFETAALNEAYSTTAALDTAAGAFVKAVYVAKDATNPHGLASSAWTHGSATGADNTSWTIGIHEVDNYTNFLKKWDKTAAESGSCPTGTDVEDNYAETFTNELQGVNVCRLPPTIGADLTLTKDNVYVLADGGTRVGNGNEQGGGTISDVTLTINPGTLVLGEDGDYLLITRNNQINATGTAAAPIYFRSVVWAKDDHAAQTSDANKKGYGTWGGIVLQGNGIDFSGEEVLGEGGVKYYGGTDNSASESSGTLKYVVLSGPGDDIDGNGNELNGVTLQGAGAGTVVEYVQIDKTLDDAIEFFGGAGTTKYLALTNVGDDAYDADNAYKGTAEYVYIHMSPEWSIGGPGESRGIEADGYDPKDSSGNKFIDPAKSATSKATVLNLSNFTLVGSGDKDYTDSGMVLRRGVALTADNFYVTGFPDAGIDIRDRGTLEDGSVTDYNTGATSWSGTYGRINLSNVAFDGNGKQVKFEMFKDEVSHLDNILDTDTAQGALEAWFDSQTNVEFFE